MKGVYHYEKSIFNSGFGSCTCIGVGLVDEHDGYEVVCGILPGESASISGLLCDRADPHSTDFVGVEEMGLLDCMAVCEYCKSDALSEGRTGVHADCQLPVSRQWRVVTIYMV